MEVDKFIKENLYNFLNGDYNDKFDKDQIDILIETSFIFNHLEVVGYTTGKGSGNKYNLKYNDLTFSLSFPEEDFYTGISKEEMIISLIRNQDFFKKMFLSFMRDYKLGKIL